MDTRSRGTLVAVGGGEDKRHEMTVLRRALLHVDGPTRRVAVIPTASREPREAARPYVDAFAALGSEVDVLDVRTRDEAADRAFAERVLRSDLVYMTGGDQTRLAEVLSGTRLFAAIRAKHEAGGVVAGTSAGAAVMSRTMIAQGEPTLRKGHVRLSEGLGLLPSAIIDTHFTERGRFGRLLEAVATMPRALGIGLDEDTAIVVRGSSAEVVGAGSVLVVDGRQLRSSNLARAAPGEPVSVEHMIVHTYCEGRAFRLDELAPVPVARRRSRRSS